MSNTLNFTDEDAARIIEEMDSDDAVDVLEQIDD